MPVISTGMALGLGLAGSIGGSIAGAVGASSAAGAQSSAAKSAAQLQAQEAQNALQFQEQVYNNNLGVMNPWLSAGRSALVNLSNLLGLPMSGDITNPTPVNVGQAPAAAALSTGGGASQIIGALRKLGINLPSGSVPLSTLSNPGSALPVAPNPQPGGSPQLPFAPPGNNPLLNPNPNPILNNRAQPGVVGRQIGGGDALPVPPAGIGPNGQPIIPRAGAISPNPAAAGNTGVPLSSLVNPSLGTFGSLMQGFNTPFVAPTAVTEANDPGYAFRLAQGEQALENSAAARGGLLSGGTAKGLEDYAQNYASNEYGNVYGRALGEYQQKYNIFQQNQANQFNRLASLAGIGQTTAGQLSSAGQNASGNVTNLLLGSGGQIGQDILAGGAANASGYAGVANALSSGLGGGLTSLSQLLMLQNLLHPGSGATPVPGTAGGG